MDNIKQALFNLEAAMSEIAAQIETQTVSINRTLAQGDIITAMQLGQDLAPLTQKHFQMLNLRHYLITKTGEHDDNH